MTRKAVAGDVPRSMVSRIQLQHLSLISLSPESPQARKTSKRPRCSSLEEPSQLPTTPVHAPVVHDARFSDLYPANQQAHQHSSLTPCPPGRYPSSPPQCPVLEDLAFDFPSPDWSDELPSHDFDEIKADPFSI